MKFLILIPLAAAALSGCTTGKCDTGDSACSGSSGGKPTLTGYAGSCGTNTCTWSIDYTGTIGTVEMELLETGDPTSTCGPDKDVVCGSWHEVHSNFSSDGNGTKSIDLTIVSSPDDQVNNSSTLFDTDAEFNQLTVLFTITDSSGSYADCGVAGHKVSYFAGECTEQLN